MLVIILNYKMFKANLTLLLLLLFVVSHAEQQVPLRKDSYGFSTGDTHGNLQIQFFLDFMCPDSKASYGVMTEVMKSIDFAQQGIKLTYQFTPLSWHFYAFKIHQAFFFILQNAGSQQAQKFIAFIFATQDNYIQQKWMDKTIAQFLDSFVEAVGSIIKIDKAALRAELDDGSTWNTVRYHWKYSVGSNSVSGAPIFNLNAVRIDGAQDYTASEWIATIKHFKKDLQFRQLSVQDFYSQLTQHK